MPFTQTRLVNPTQLTTSASSALYTVATGYTAVIKQIVVTNTTGNARTFTIYIGTTAVASNAIFSGTSIAANDSVVINLSQVLNAGDSIFALADANSALNLTVSGVVNDGPLSPVASYITDGQITTPKIADNAITTAKIAAGAVVTADLANNAVTQAKLSTDVPLSGMRNLIINGDMRIDQRNTTITGNGFTVDRWLAYHLSSGAVSKAKSADAPSGFTASLRATATTGAAVSAANQFRQQIEGSNIASLAWGSSSAKQINISFWVKSSLSGTYSVYLGNSNALRMYVATYTINSANTWEYKTINIVGDTSGTWSTDTGTGIDLRFIFGVHSAYATTTLNQWFDGNGMVQYFGPSTVPDVMATTNNIFAITGVQLEAGSQATPFEQRPFGLELALCQRYYYRVAVQSGETNLLDIYVGVAADQNTWIRYAVPFPVQMRVKPTYSASGTFTNLLSGGGYGTTANGSLIQSPYAASVYLYSAGIAYGASGSFRMTSSGTYIDFSAEIP